MIYLLAFFLVYKKVLHQIIGHRGRTRHCFGTGKRLAPGRLSCFAELTARVRALLRRDLRVRVPLLQYKDLKLDQAARVVWQGNRRVELTSKEFGILKYLLRHQGEIVSQEALLEGMR